MLESKRPGLTITEEPGGMLRKQLLDYDGTVLLDETILPHDDLIRFVCRPLREYRRQLTEFEKHSLFKESPIRCPSGRSRCGSPHPWRSQDIGEIRELAREMTAAPNGTAKAVAG